MKFLSLKRHLLNLIVILLIVFNFCLAEKADEFELTIDNIMEGPKLVGISPSNIIWLPDSSRVYFRWKKPDEEKVGIYYILKKGEKPIKVKDELKGEAILRGEFSSDGNKVVFSRNGDIYIYDLKKDKIYCIVQTPFPNYETFPHFTQDSRKIYFKKDNNLFLLSLETGMLKQLTNFLPRKEKKKLTPSQEWLTKQQRELFEVFKHREKEALTLEKRTKQAIKPYYLNPNESITYFQLSPDENHVLFLLEERIREARKTIVPNYITISGYTENIFSRTKVGDISKRRKLGILKVKTGEIIWPDYGIKDKELEPIFYFWGHRIRTNFWSKDGKKCLIACKSIDFKDRWIFLLDLFTGKTKILDHLHDPAWVGYLSYEFGWLPDNESIYFTSEKDGFAHLYTISINGGKAKQLTKGKFEVYSPRVSKNGEYFYFTSNEVHPGERHFYIMSINGGERIKITCLEGNNRVYLSPDESTLAILYSYSNKPWELYLQPNHQGAKAKQITLSTTEKFRSYSWIVPEIVQFTARDGAKVYARLYKPKNPKKNSPAVIFVHGAGYLQNAHKWWSSYYREYMFHHFLMEHGYYVLDIDYRGSAGYGRDWRTAIYRHMGGKDLTDQIDGARFLVERYGVDSKRIGIYGGSYGGFITLMAMFKTPDVFAAGAALRPVTDWAHYSHVYTEAILNLPQDDEEAYKRSSPIYFAEGLKNPLLICHGVVDTNVHFQDVVRLVQRLIELRKENWELAIYPVEGHGFRNPSSWADEYKRIFKLFETYLKK
jgi:dipeptidyl aminopeptidase/acylaminoacyl peptidase